MTPNATLRDFTSNRAFELSQVAKKIVETESYNNFDMVYYDYDIEAAMDLHVSRGGEKWQVIEVVDGFHPSTTAMSLTAEIFWKYLMEDKPEIFGERNPFNEQIKQVQDTAWGIYKCDDAP